MKRRFGIVHGSHTGLLAAVALLVALAGTVAAEESGSEKPPASAEEQRREKHTGLPDPAVRKPKEDPDPPSAEKQRREEHTGPTVAEGEKAFDIRARDVYVMFWWDRGLLYEAHSTLGHPEEKTEFRKRWSEGLEFKGRVGLKIAVDGSLFNADDSLPEFDDGIGIRRFYAYATGEFHFLAPAYYKVEVGLVDEDWVFREGYLWFQDVSYIGTLKLGIFDAPMSLEALTSSRDLPLMERAAPVAAFAPGSRLGLQVSDTAGNDRMTWAVGAFTGGSSIGWGDASDSVLRVVSRVTWLPLYEIGRESVADQLIHLGVSANFKISGSNSVQYQARPEAYFAPYVIDTGEIDSDAAFTVNPEAAWLMGPMSIQGEIFGTHAESKDEGNLDFWGIYSSASYFLTGETRPYDRSKGVFGHVIPEGSTAVELTGRVSYTDLTDGPVEGGRMLEVTGGANWYLSRYVRLMGNIAYARIRDTAEEGNVLILQARFQLYF